MTEQEIFAQRAQMYARPEQVATTGEARFLQVRQGGVAWYFPKAEIRQLVKLDKWSRLPAGALWENWPCLGTVWHGHGVLPVLCWQVLVAGSELRASRSEGLLLLLRHAPVAIRVEEEGLTAVSLEVKGLAKDPHPWSAGRVPEGGSVALLERFREGVAR